MFRLWLLGTHLHFALLASKVPVNLFILWFLICDLVYLYVSNQVSNHVNRWLKYSLDSNLLVLMSWFIEISGHYGCRIIERGWISGHGCSAAVTDASAFLFIWPLGFFFVFWFLLFVITTILYFILFSSKIFMHVARPTFRDLLWSLFDHCVSNHRWFSLGTRLLSLAWQW